MKRGVPPFISVLTDAELADCSNDFYNWRHKGMRAAKGLRDLEIKLIMEAVYSSDCCFQILEKFINDEIFNRWSAHAQGRTPGKCGRNIKKG